MPKLHPIPSALVSPEHAQLRRVAKVAMVRLFALTIAQPPRTYDELADAVLTVFVGHGVRMSATLPRLETDRGEPGEDAYPLDCELEDTLDMPAPAFATGRPS